MTGKERAARRAQAHNLVPVTQIGKGGIGEDLIRHVEDALTARELIKVKVLLETTPIPPKEAAEQLAAATGAEVCGVVGGVIILYRYSPELHEKERQKKANIRKAERVSRQNAKERARKRYAAERKKER
ncbi:MAG TPA: YhbY family RNA-binding protein [Clostridiales bacterium]|nr:YhbY family RNA-binding protein [Clostridiales bacterium]